MSELLNPAPCNAAPEASQARRLPGTLAATQTARFSPTQSATLLALGALNMMIAQHRQ